MCVLNSRGTIKLEHTVVSILSFLFVPLYLVRKHLEHRENGKRECSFCCTECSRSRAFPQSKSSSYWNSWKVATQTRKTLSPQKCYKNFIKLYTTQVVLGKYSINSNLKQAGREGASKRKEQRRYRADALKLWFDRISYFSFHSNSSARYYTEASFLIILEKYFFLIGCIKARLNCQDVAIKNHSTGIRTTRIQFEFNSKFGMFQAWSATSRLMAQRNT